MSARSRINHGARRLRLPALSLRNRDSAVICPTCGWRGRSFLVFRDRPNAVCPRCGALERHRALWLVLRDMLSSDRRYRVLHFAPEACLERNFRRLSNIDYVSADLEAKADLQLDITRMRLSNASFDVLVCSHVLEHVPDDIVAMREMRRVLDPQGFALLMVPRNLSLQTTHEDPSIVDPEDRAREFGQHDHVRIYGEDFVERLEDAGWAVSRLLAAERFGPALLTRHGIYSHEELFITRPTSSRSPRALE